jgi:hypothetical protein
VQEMIKKYKILVSLLLLMAMHFSIYHNAIGQENQDPPLILAGKKSLLN